MADDPDVTTYSCHEIVAYGGASEALVRLHQPGEKGRRFDEPEDLPMEAVASLVEPSHGVSWTSQMPTGTVSCGTP